MYMGVQTYYLIKKGKCVLSFQHNVLSNLKYKFHECCMCSMFVCMCSMCMCSMCMRSMCMCIMFM